MSTFEKLWEIFYSGNPAFHGLKEPINEISFLIDNDYLIFSETLIASKKKYLDFFYNLEKDKEKINLAAGGEMAHVVLKILSGQYLEHRNLAVDYEHSFCGFFPDVLSKDKLVIIECGLTQNPDKILTYFNQGKIHEFIQVPYPTDESGAVSGYVFTATNELNNFLTFLEKEKNTQIKILFKKRY